LIGLIRVPGIEREFGESAEHKPDALLCAPSRDDRQHGLGAGRIGGARRRRIGYVDCQGLRGRYRRFFRQHVDDALLDRRRRDAEKR
jgi:hypothetical protein